jgi:hypothetical protein
MKPLEVAFAGKEQSGNHLDASEDPSDFCDFGYDIYARHVVFAQPQIAEDGLVKPGSITFDGCAHPESPQPSPAPAASGAISG